MANPGELSLDKDVPIAVRDGTVLRADVFRPLGAGRFPVVMTHGPYGKDIHFEEFNARAYSLVDERGPFMNWETVNPQWWVPHGYVVVRVDQRGTGRSPGQMHLFSPQEFEDFYDAIEWAGVQEWSNGKVGLLGVSYYAIGQWHVAAMKPPHLAAIVPWEGAIDFYREWSHHGGILADGFTDAWWSLQITANQSALAEGAGNPNAAVGGNVDLPGELRDHQLFDQFYEDRTTELSRIDVPVLSAGSWSGYALHLRGNVEGFLGAGSQHKWLEVHSGNHFTPFYSEESREYQRAFLDRFLKDDASSFADERPVKLFIRRSTGGTWRYEDEWPIARTRWSRFYLDAPRGSIGPSEPAEAGRVSYDAPGGGSVFFTAPFTEDLEITGPSALEVWVDSSSGDMDLFVTVVNMDPSGREVVFEDASGNPGPVVKGWLRASHRELDEERSLPYRPFHPHTSAEALPPGRPTLVSVEIWPTSMVFEAGHRLGLVIESHDRREPTRFLHDDEHDRAGTSTGTNTIHTGGATASYLLLPVIPKG